MNQNRCGIVPQFAAAKLQFIYLYSKQLGIFLYFFVKVDAILRLSKRFSIHHLVKITTVTRIGELSEDYIKLLGLYDWNMLSNLQVRDIYNCRYLVHAICQCFSLPLYEYFHSMTVKKRCSSCSTGSCGHLVIWSLRSLRIFQTQSAAFNIWEI